MSMKFFNYWTIDVTYKNSRLPFQVKTEMQALYHMYIAFDYILSFAYINSLLILYLL